MRGRSDIAAFVRNAIDAVTTVHHGHTPEIEVTSPTQRHRDLGDGGHTALAGRRADPGLHGYGHYHDTYASLDGRWFIASTTLTRLRVDVEMPD